MGVMSEVLQSLPATVCKPQSLVRRKKREARNAFEVLNEKVCEMLMNVSVVLLEQM